MGVCFKSAAWRHSRRRRDEPAVYILTWLRLALTLAIGWPSEGNAQVSAADKAAAEVLFDHGLRLMQEGELQEACLKFERSQAIEAGIGTMLYLADCYERIGRTASAWAMFREAASTAKAKGQPDRAEIGAERAKQLEPRLTSLSIRPARPVPDLLVFRNGQLLPSSLYGVAVPVDPGEQHIEARAEGYKPFETTVTLEGDRKHLNVDLPTLQAVPKSDTLAVQAPSGRGELSAGGSTTVRPTPSVAYPKVESASMWSQTLALTLGAVGLVGIGAGTYFGARAIWKNNAADARCPDGLCQSDKAYAFDSAARSAAKLSTLCWIGGAAFVLGGVVLYFAGPEGQAQSVALRPLPAGLELSVGGAL